MAIFYGVTVTEFLDTFRRVNDMYAGNLVAYDVRDASNKSGPAVSFRLTVEDNTANARGARGGYRPGKGPKGLKRTSSACWHAWYDVFASLAETGINKGRHVKTLATPGSGFRWYESDPTMGAVEFRSLMDGSNTNAGSEANPIDMTDLCECD